jgi:hypothetical protein
MGCNAAYTTFEKAAGAVQEKYGEYYAKVARKVKDNQD